VEHENYAKAVRKCVYAIGTTKATQPPQANADKTQLAQEYAIAKELEKAATTRLEKAREALLSELGAKRDEPGTKRLLHDDAFVSVIVQCVIGQERIDKRLLETTLMNVLDDEERVTAIIQNCTKQDANQLRTTVLLKK
jgi:hypothetical protein